MKMGNILIRPAKIIDSDRIAELEQDYYSQYPSNFRAPKSSKRIRRDIGSSMLMKNSSYYLVAEHQGRIIGSIEIRIDRNHRMSLISQPFIDLRMQDYRSLQKELLEYTIQNLKEMKINRTQIEVSVDNSSLQYLLKEFKFIRKKTIFEVWEGEIKPEIFEDEPEINIRKINPNDAKVSFSWVEEQLDRESPLYISYDAYRRFFKAPKNMTEGWAIAEREEIPVAIISSFIDNSGTVIVFGPFCSEKNQDVRIPLFNELLWMYKLRNQKDIRVMRIKSILNDDHLFETFGLDLTYLVNLYERKI